MPHTSRTSSCRVSEGKSVKRGAFGFGRRAAGNSPSSIPVALRTEFDDPTEVTTVYADVEDEATD